jgi:PEP-CTERM motif
MKSSRHVLCAVAILLALAPLSAIASTIFVYDLTSDGSNNGGTDPALSGSITVVGDPGDTFPALDSVAVLGFNFNMDGFLTWTNSNTVVSDTVGFNGTLGAATLSPLTGVWVVDAPPPGQGDLDLYSPASPGAEFGQLWDWSQNGAIGDAGFSWSLVLASETASAPEPSTGYMLLAAAGLAGLLRWMQHRRQLNRQS